MVITRKEHMGKLGEIAMQSKKWPEFFRGSRIVGADSPPHWENAELRSRTKPLFVVKYQKPCHKNNFLIVGLGVFYDYRRRDWAHWLEHAHL